MSRVTPRLAHVAVVVRDLDRQTSVPAAVLGLAVRDRAAVSGEDATVSFLRVGRADVELVQPLSQTGPLARFLDAHGESIHHLALRVPDLGAAIAAADRAGLRFAGRAPRLGAHGTRIAFVHPASLHGVLVELVEDAKQV
ncbi:MAG TPA: VOC family protein [bacterium]|nr:VOC family protein [bacterium]